MKEEAKHSIAQQRSHRRVRNATLALLVIAAVIGGYIYIQSIPPPPGMYDDFAKCIAQTNTKFYGAFWCPHCAAQKRVFGDSAQYLPYVECSLPDESGELQVCVDDGIKSYPTWTFPDGSRLSGELSLATLAEKTGCALPNQNLASSTVDVTVGSSSAAQ